MRRALRIWAKARGGSMHAPPSPMLTHELGISIATNRCDTIGGFILMLLGRLPRAGEKVGYEGFEFNIEEVFDYGISSIRAVKPGISAPWKKR